MAVGGHHGGHATAPDHGHAGVPHAQAGDHQPAAKVPADAGTPEKPSEKAHCPPCVSCCAAAVIAPALQLPVAENSASAAIAAIAYSVPGALPDELDRPPLAL